MGETLHSHSHIYLTPHTTTSPHIFYISKKKFKDDQLKLEYHFGKAESTKKYENKNEIQKEKETILFSINFLCPFYTFRR